MADYRLLSLDLRSPLDYRGIENPPFRGVPPAPESRPGGGPAENGAGEPLAEGEEELFVFDAEDLVAFDPDDGPRAPGPLPPPRFHGRRKAGPRPGPRPAPGAPNAAAPAESGGVYLLPAGEYLFMQFRPADEAALIDGIEWFAREAWWEGSPGAGPYAVRRLREDGRLAVQLLRRK